MKIDELKFEKGKLNDSSISVAYARFKYFHLFIKQKEEELFDVCFINSMSRDVIPVKEVLPQSFIEELTSLTPKTILSNLKKESISKVLDYIEDYDKQVEAYLTSFQEYSDRIVSLPTTVQ